MKAYTTIREIERKLRASKCYHDWVLRNQSACCFVCNKTDNLECHHVVDLYHILIGLWKLYGEPEKTLQHALDLHSNDKCESVTLCNICHSKRHPGRHAIPKQNVRIELWTTLPRNLRLNLYHSKIRINGSLGLIGFQTLLGIGWYVLTGKMQSRILEFNRRRFAELLDKNPGTSFNRSLEEAIRELHQMSVIVASHRSDNDIEIHLSKQYLNSLLENPWFIPLSDIKANQMCVLALKWFVGMQSNRRYYKICLDKLINHLGIRTKSYRMAARAIQEACNKISWLSVKIEKRMCCFKINRRGATPIFSLRKILSDSIHHSK